MTNKEKILGACAALLAFFASQYTLVTLSLFGSLANKMVQFWIAGFLTLVGTALSYWYISKENKQATKPAPYRYRDTWVAIGCYYLFITTITVLATLLHVTPQAQSNQSALNELFKTNPILLGLYIAILAPVIEELVFRYIIPKYLSFNTQKDWLGYTIGLIIFIFLHSPQGILGFISYSALALMFTYMRIRYNDIRASILTHITWNSIILLIMFLQG